uniref:Uncharacterized protein n=1 Tax=Cacopsylla melanoneura TaxID=428564 RepID=A0A8D8ZE17_9HEMI
MNPQVPHSNFLQTHENVRGTPNSRRENSDNGNACGDTGTTVIPLPYIPLVRENDTPDRGTTVIPLTYSPLARENDNPHPDQERSCGSNVISECINCLAQPASVSHASLDGKMTATFSPGFCQFCKSSASPLTQILSPDEFLCNKLDVPSHCSTCGNDRPYVQGELVLEYMGYTLVKVKCFIPKNGIENALMNA